LLHFSLGAGSHSLGGNVPMRTEGKGQLCLHQKLLLGVHFGELFRDDAATLADPVLNLTCDLFPEFSPNFKPIIEVKPYSWPDENPPNGPLLEANSSYNGMIAQI